MSKNQCDGCRAGKPVDSKGNHRMGKPGGYADLMACTAHLYRDECRCGCYSGGCGRPDGCRCTGDCPCQSHSS